MTPLSAPQLEQDYLEVLRRFAARDLDSAAALIDTLCDEQHPRIVYLRGMLAMYQGRHEDAQAHLAMAAATIGDDPSVQADWLLSLVQCGRFDAALQAAGPALARFPRYAGLHFCRGLAFFSRNESSMAVDALLVSLQYAPGDPRSLTLLGQAYHAMDRHADAERALQSVLSRDPGNAYALHCLANVLIDARQYQRALEYIDRSMGLAPETASTWGMRAMALHGLNRDEEALVCAERSCVLDRFGSESLRARGVAYKALGRMQEAADDFLSAMRLRFAATAGSASRLPEHRRYSIAKLRHDIEQYDYLSTRLAHGDFAAKADLHRQMLEAIPVGTPEGRILDLPLDALRASDGIYNRLHHLAEAPRLPGGALNPALDTSAIEADYFGRGPGITWVDGLLSEDALASLRKYCLESTIWFDFHHLYGYLGALIDNGFAAPLLLQVAEELRAKLPNVFLDYPLVQMWAFKYDHKMQGIQMHADVAAVNLNFWITPDEANLDPDSGGLVVWDKAAPAEWDFDDFNTSNVERQARIDTFLRESGAQAVRVPYRQNRAVLFNSDLFHATDTLNFKDGYENRRINITMLFGLRNRRAS